MKHSQNASVDSCPHNRDVPADACPRLEARPFFFQGTRCRDCARPIEKRLSRVKGTTQVRANPAAQFVKIHYDADTLAPEALEEQLKKAGYKARSAPRTQKELQDSWNEQEAERRRLATLTAICLIAALLGWGGQATGVLSQPAALFLYAISYIAGGFEATRTALRDLRNGSLNVDLLMIVAAGGAAAVGEWPEGAALLFLFSLSNTLEGFVLERTRRAIQSLMGLSPDEATVLRNGQEQRVPVEELQRNETLLIRPGERIATDGKVLSGASSIDQSAITGESVPVHKEIGDTVFAGTLNGSGVLKVCITKTASESTLAGIVHLVEEAQSEKAPSERFTDWFGARYTMGVLSASALAIVLPVLFFSVPFDTAFYRAMTLLVVASPCAVVISIPAAIMSAIASGARNGVLIKGGAHLEGMGQIRAIAFDKTGTLTIGRPQLMDVVAASGQDELEVLALAASAERSSEHPLATAIVEAARARNLTLKESSETRALVGRGLQARVEGELIFVGKAELWTERGIILPEKLQAAAARFSDEGKTSFFVGSETQVLGVLALADVLRSSAATALERLKALGIERITMLTGDNEGVARKIAGELGMSYRAELMPQEKLEAIRELQKEFGKVAMVGDGINDAPSLAAADLGVSLGGTGTDVALETAEVVLMSGDLENLPDGIALARQTQKIILQNLAFAFLVMALLVAGTFFASLRLPLAVLGHEGSTVLVILNGLRLLSFRTGRANKPAPAVAS